ncbi:MAG: UDP-3-O-(3-hydroxymyristoyl)glucosamine N-acyltransferase, partial [Proteobacteria bacterium]|nr:UDP-3-O-(3-hydroxymyristoyl)glucosamine N-acyltransferase [Pseudomonadota bacterium]
MQAVRPLDVAGADDLSFLDNEKYRDQAKATKAAAVLVREADAALLPAGCIPLVVPQPYMAFARALMVMYPAAKVVPGISEFAVVSAKAMIDPTARIEPYAVIYAGAKIGAGAHIGAHCVVGEGVQIGAGTVLFSHATVMKAVVGERCVIHSGVRIGQDGFGFAAHNDVIIKIPQVGSVRIGNEVEIGANSTIDCAALGETVIEDGVKIDNQVQIAHNVQIGKHSRIVAQVGVAGSSKLGQFSLIGGQSGIAGHVTLADRVMVAARSGVIKSVENVSAVVAGFPAVDIQEWRRAMGALSM